MKTIIFSLVICMLLGLLITAGGCAGCSHRHRRVSERHRERVEKRNRYDGRDSNCKEDVESYRGKYSEKELQSLVAGTDYDSMLDAMYYQLKELKKVKTEYFKGEMTDKEAERRVEEINNLYAPIRDKLSKASSEGELTYNQHKKQLKLLAEYMKLIASISTHIGSDIDL